jgi:hypothetical protein
MTIPGFTADQPLNKAMNRYSSAKAQELSASQVTAQACRKICGYRFKPESCLYIPWPFCLWPQRECSTLCDVPS